MRDDMRQLLRAYISEHAMSGVITPDEVLHNILKEVDLTEEDFPDDRKDLLYNMANGLLRSLDSDRLLAKPLILTKDTSVTSTTKKYPIDRMLQDDTLKYLACKFAPMCKMSEKQLITETYYSDNVQRTLCTHGGFEEVLHIFMGRTAMQICEKCNITFNPHLPTFESFGNVKGVIPFPIAKVVPIGCVDSTIWKEAYQWVVSTTDIYFLRDLSAFISLVNETHAWMRRDMYHATDGDYGKWKLIDLMEQDTLRDYSCYQIRDCYYSTGLSRFRRWDTALNAVRSECEKYDE